MAAVVTPSVQECLASVNDLLASHSALLTRCRETQERRRRELRALPSPPEDILKIPLIPSPSPSPPPSPPSSPLVLLPPKPKPQRPDLPPAKRARLTRFDNYVPEEETIRNDYSQRYVDGGEWPQDWVLGADPDHRFEEYPKQQRLLSLKKAAVAACALPPTYLPYSELSSLSPSKFDVIIIDPPFSSSFTWDDLQDLPIPALAADPSFVLMWVGSGAGEGLERGRGVMAKWGFRRCEDIVWVKTNKTTNKGPGTDPPTTSLLTRTKQHCLMGIRGTVRRSTDSWFVHCNVDTDVLIWEGDSEDPTLKPPEMFTLIENFCLGLRRLELFGRAKTLRRGWVTALAEGEEDRVQHDVEMRTPEKVGEDPALQTDEQDDAPVRWNREAWEAKVKGLVNGGKLVVPMTSEIDALRPKSPVRGGSSNMNSGAANLPSNPTQLATMAVPMGMSNASGGNSGMSRGPGGAGSAGGFTHQGRMAPPTQSIMNMASLAAANALAGTVGVDPNMNMMPWQDMNIANGMGNMGNMGMGNIGPQRAAGNMGGLPPRMNPGMNPQMNMGINQAQPRMGGFQSQGDSGFGGYMNSGQMQNMNGPMQMAWMGGDQGQFAGNSGGMWDGQMGDGMMGMNVMNGMSGMGNMMNVGAGMNPGMGSGMGMNIRMGQWGGESFDGFHRQ